MLTVFSTVTCCTEFYVLLTVHLAMILVNNQIDAQFFLVWFFSILDMFRAAMCPLSGELLYQCDTRFVSLCVDDRLVCRSICSCILLETSLYITQQTHNFFLYVYFYSLNVSGSHVPIIRRIILSMRYLVYINLCR